MVTPSVVVDLVVTPSVVVDLVVTPSVVVVTSVHPVVQTPTQVMAASVPVHKTSSAMPSALRVAKNSSRHSRTSAQTQVLLVTTSSR